jgi:hypothetical protein
MRKAAFVAGVVVGYVFGSRAGQERYEQIARAGRAFANNPQVQDARAALTHQAGDMAGRAAQVAGTIGSRMGSRVTDRLPGRRFGAHENRNEAPAPASPAEQAPLDGS